MTDCPYIHHKLNTCGFKEARSLVAINRTSVPQLAETPILVWQAGWRKNPVIICLSIQPPQWPTANNSPHHLLQLYGVLKYYVYMCTFSPSHLLCLIQAIEMWYRRKAEVVARMDRVLNEDIRRRLGIEAVLGEKKKSGERRSRKCHKRGL